MGRGVYVLFISIEHIVTIDEDGCGEVWANVSDVDFAEQPAGASYLTGSLLCTN